jgi:hypothetical protein
MSAIPLLSRDKQTSGERVENDANDPERKSALTNFRGQESDFLGKKTRSARKLG